MDTVSHPTRPPAFDPTRVDAEGFARELDELHARLRAGVGEADRQHLHKMRWWSRACSWLGLATSWIAPNPLSVLLLALGNTTRWAVVAHHTSHGSLDPLSDAKADERSKSFARGARRFVDWLDWMHPEAWHLEHDVLHHAYTGDPGDPDVAERNARLLRDTRAPKPIKWLVIALLAMTWKLIYYAPNTFHILWREQKKRAGLPVPPEQREAWFRTMLPLSREGVAFWWTCVLPYSLVRFVALPALFLPLGADAAANVLLSLLAAELIANAHAFFIIVPNHTADDLYRFEARGSGKAEYYLRQVLGSTNYACGSDGIDFLQGYLNYQIEHHLWPRLPPLKLREAQPEVKRICETYGVPYVQESVHRRAARLIDIMTGTTSMKPDPFRPAHEAPSPLPLPSLVEEPRLAG